MVCRSWLRGCGRDCMRRMLKQARNFMCERLWRRDSKAARTGCVQHTGPTLLLAVLARPRAGGTSTTPSILILPAARSVDTPSRSGVPGRVRRHCECIRIQRAVRRMSSFAAPCGTSFPGTRPPRWLVSTDGTVKVHGYSQSPSASPRMSVYVPCGSCARLIWLRPLTVN
ncbi:uncharacterized protein C8Q71DRAFT_218231 [Rhodofomes roseus]|uniref:Uncharacterized protein n=1 Tax=Rhodofomes roseus TaxID=34475 RepID=A0ABQ8KW35_9APHY|nr:uncharacterized protein C8Q71DRAFT_218231 [Rhodofomes roseus]KAH9842739.1 hypothetical protein C8Q71DRAFT_218231 [Rhodofomes roseus]